MTRRRKPRQRPKRRKRTARASARPLRGVLGWTGRSGWGRFAAGILIGLVLGIGGVVYANSSWLHQSGAADKVIAAASPESRDPSTGARVKIEAPRLVEAASAQPTGEEAVRPVTPLPPPRVVEAPVQSTESATAAPVTPATPPTVPRPEPAVITNADGSSPAWMRNAVAFAVPRDRPVIAIVLDDVGVNKRDAEQAIALPAEITLAFMTYAPRVDEMVKRARAKGHEILVHVPMEPLSTETDPGPNVLRVADSDQRILEQLRWGLERFGGYVGINNHMGSRFTQDERGMRIVMQELKRRDLLFLDSKTIATSVGGRLAEELGVPHVDRDVFLDDDMDGSAVLRQLALAERVAREHGHAIAIGHPHPATIAAIKAWLPRAKAQGFIVAPLSTVAKLRLGAAG